MSMQLMHFNRQLILIIHMQMLILNYLSYFYKMQKNQKEI